MSAPLDLAYAYAAAVDRRDAAAVAAMFTPDGALLIHATGDAEPRRAYRGREEIERILGGMAARFTVTTHLVANHTAEVGGDTATALTYCQATHLYEADGGTRAYVMSIRYLDTLVRREGRWLFAERAEYVDWAEDRPFHGVEI